MENVKEKGLQAENFFMSKLNELGIPYLYIDDWYDFEVLKQKVEVKSARLSTRHKARGLFYYRTGRFDFTSEENRELQYKENIWICFIVRHYEQFIFYGFTKARNLKKKRYISINKLREFDILSLEKWIKEVNK